MRNHLIVVLGFCPQGANPTEHSGNVEVRPVIFQGTGVSQSESQQSSLRCAGPGGVGLLKTQRVPTGLQPAGG